MTRHDGNELKIVMGGGGVHFPPGQTPRGCITASHSHIPTHKYTLLHLGKRALVHLVQALSFILYPPIVCLVHTVFYSHGYEGIY